MTNMPALGELGRQCRDQKHLLDLVNLFLHQWCRDLQVEIYLPSYACGNMRCTLMMKGIYVRLLNENIDSHNPQCLYLYNPKEEYPEAIVFVTFDIDNKCWVFVILV